MASIVDRPSATGRGLAVGARGMLLLACALAAGGAWLVGDPSARLAADPETATLLRSMALLKATFFLPAFAAVWWRFGRPTGPGFRLAYTAVVAVMAGAAMLVWQLSFLGLTSLAFHAALISLLVLAWRDDGIAKGPLGRS